MSAGVEQAERVREVDRARSASMRVPSPRQSAVEVASPTPSTVSTAALAKGLGEERARGVARVVLDEASPAARGTSSALGELRRAPTACRRAARRARAGTGAASAGTCASDDAARARASRTGSRRTRRDRGRARRARRARGTRARRGSGSAGIVLDAAEALLLHRGDDARRRHERRGGVVVVRRRCRAPRSRGASGGRRGRGRHRGARGGCQPSADARGQRRRAATRDRPGDQVHRGHREREQRRRDRAAGAPPRPPRLPERGRAAARRARRARRPRARRAARACTPRGAARRPAPRRTAPRCASSPLRAKCRAIHSNCARPRRSPRARTPGTAPRPAARTAARCRRAARRAARAGASSLAARSANIAAWRVSSSAWRRYSARAPERRRELRRVQQIDAAALLGARERLQLARTVAGDAPHDRRDEADERAARGVDHGGLAGSRRTHASICSQCSTSASGHASGIFCGPARRVARDARGVRRAVHAEALDVLAAPLLAPRRRRTPGSSSRRSRARPATRTSCRAAGTRAARSRPR